LASAIISASAGSDRTRGGRDGLESEPHLTARRAAAVGAELVSKEESFDRADIVSVHLVLSGRTRGLVGAAELALMKRTAYNGIFFDDYSLRRDPVN
jgi:D-isomer specific 2-hydroxyacid dehydrogenase, NAD binding domain